MNAFPTDIEKLVMIHPSIHDCSCVGYPNNLCGKGEMGEIPVIFVQIKQQILKNQNYDQKVLKEEILELMSKNYHIEVGDVFFIDQIPYSPAGKTYKEGLRKLIKDGMYEIKE